VTVHVDLVVPTYNEAGNLRRMVDHTVSTLRSRRGEWTFGVLLVVSDGSTDGTQQLAAELDAAYPEVSRLVRTENFGFGNAIKDGLAHADGDVLIPFMADLSDDPADVPKLVDQIRAGYDVVYGSRFVAGGSVDGYPPLKLLYNRAFNNGIRLLFGLRERDVTNAFTAYRARVIDEIGVETLASESFDLTAELPLRATVEGFRTTEVPVSWQSREAGVSNLDATRKGPVYVRRVFEQFLRGNAAGLADLFDAVGGQNRRRVVGAAVLGVVVLFGLVSLSGAAAVTEAIVGADPALVAAVAVVYPVSFLFRTWRWRVLLRASGHLASRANVFRAIAAGWLFNSLLPARAGDVLRGYALKTTDGTPFSVGAGTIVVARAFDMVVLGTLTSVVALAAVRSGRTFSLAAGAFGIAALLIGGLAVPVVFGDRLERLVGPYAAGLGDAIGTLRTALTSVAGNPFALGLSLALSVPVWLVELSTIFLSARAVGVELGVVPSAAAGISAFLSQTLPLTPGGVGTYEAAIASVLTLFGVATPVGTAVGVVDHVTRLAVISVLGAVCTVHLVFASRPYFRETDETESVSDAETVSDTPPE
jgi:hypothetical protein